MLIRRINVWNKRALCPEERGVLPANTHLVVNGNTHEDMGDSIPKRGQVKRPGRVRVRVLQPRRTLKVSGYEE